MTPSSHIQTECQHPSMSKLTYQKMKKEADKGGTIIIMDKIFYKNKIEELLSDTDNYVLVKGGNQHESIIKKIEKLLNKFKEEKRKQKKNTFTSFPEKRRISMDYQKYTNPKV